MSKIASHVDFQRIVDEEHNWCLQVTAPKNIVPDQQVLDIRDTNTITLLGQGTSHEWMQIVGLRIRKVKKLITICHKKHGDEDITLERLVAIAYRMDGRTIGDNIRTLVEQHTAWTSILYWMEDYETEVIPHKLITRIMKK